MVIIRLWRVACPRVYTSSDKHPMREKVWPHKTTLQFFSLCTDTVENHEFLDIPVHVTKLTHACSDYGRS